MIKIFKPKPIASREIRSQKRTQLGGNNPLESLIKKLKNQYYPSGKIISKIRFSQIIKQALLGLPSIKRPYYQNFFIKKILRQSKKTQIGKDYQFRKIRTIKDFCTQVPLFDYFSLKPYIDRTLKGERSILYPGITDWFATSSGTGGTQKYIPITQDHLKTSHFRGGMDSLVYYLRSNPQSKLFEGKVLAIGGNLSFNPHTGEKNIGFISAILQKESPWIGQYFRAPSLSISYISDWEEKILAIIQETRHQNITALAGQPSRISSFLEKVIAITGTNTISELWPNLELFYRGGMAIDGYLPTLQKLLPPKTKYYQVYNASEGYFATQDRNDAEDMLLLTQHGIFYEFIPFDLYDPENRFPQTITLKEVKVGISYVIIISNNSGLWRYLLGDTIMFTQLNPWRIKVLGRIHYHIDVVGESVSYEYIEKAIRELANFFGTTISNYTLAPLIQTQQQETLKSYDWIIESDDLIDQATIVADKIDEILGNFHSYYYDERHHTKILSKPRVTIVPQQTFYRWMMKNNKLGGQFKVPKVANDRKNIEDFLSWYQTSQNSKK